MKDITITDLQGNVEMLVDYKGLTRKRRVNADRHIEFEIISTGGNSHSFNMVKEESIIDLDGQLYRIKSVVEKTKGRKVVKKVEAEAKHIGDSIDTSRYETLSGTLTITQAMTHALIPTHYSFIVIDSFKNTSFENFGNENSLALVNKVLERYDAEMTVNDAEKRITIYKRALRSTDSQFRYKYNLKAIEKDVKTTKLSTYIKGFGKRNEDGTYVVTAEYTSPNASLFPADTVDGLRHAPAVYDERFTDYESLLAEIKSRLNDEPEIVFTVDLVQLRDGGFEGHVVEGDEVYVIHEPLGIDIIARIMEIEDYPGSEKAPKITLANYKSNVADKISNTSKEVGSIKTPQGTIDPNLMDSAIRIVVQAIQSAQTELEFTNGIVAREKESPNELVILNSQGLGISDNGGVSFKEAITAKGFNLSAGVIGFLNFNNIKGGSIEGETLTIIGLDGSKLELAGPVLTQTNAPEYNEHGEVVDDSTATLKEGQVVSKNRKVNPYNSDVAGDQVTLNSNMLKFEKNPEADYEYMANYSIEAVNNPLIIKGKEIQFDVENNDHVYAVRFDFANETYRMRLGNLSKNGLLRFERNKEEFEFRNRQDTTWTTVKGVFSTQATRESMKNITPETQTYLDKIESTPVYRFHYLSDSNFEFKRLGIILDEAPPEIVNPTGTSIELQEMITYLWKGVQELTERVKTLEGN